MDHIYSAKEKEINKNKTKHNRTKTKTDPCNSSCDNALVCLFTVATLPIYNSHF